MRKVLMAAAGIAALAGVSVSSPVVAQERTLTGAAIGAGSGALVAGPVGAVVGGVAGAVIGGPRVSGPRRSRGARNARSCWTNSYGQRVCRSR